MVDMPQNPTKLNLIYLIYSSEHEDENDVKEKSKCEITFYFKAL